MSSLPLFDDTLGSPLWARFRVFHAANPDVYRELVVLARLAQARGRRRYGIKALFEVLRWARAATNSADEFKLNNNLAPYYARQIMENEPALAGFFELRSTTAEREDDSERC